MLAYELPGVNMPFDMKIASSAHLGGMLTGLLYYRFVHNAAWFNPEDRPEVELPRWVKRARKVRAGLRAFDVKLTPPPNSPRGHPGGSGSDSRQDQQPRIRRVDP